MRYFVPDIVFPQSAPAQQGPRDQLGGLPWGLAAADWPRCADCGGSLSLLAQFVHHPERLDLGRSGRVLMVFQCNHNPGMCETWEGGSGANACLVVEPESLAEGPSALPDDEPEVEVEVVVTGWMARDDGVSAADAASFYDEDSYAQLDDAVIDGVSTGSKLGGLPCWIQSPNEHPGPQWRFLGQLEEFYSFHRDPGVDDGHVYQDEERWEGRSHYRNGPNFGGGGIGYLFLRPDPSQPQAGFFWQC